jgi:Ca2+-binding RTX toxin-like protein
LFGKRWLGSVIACAALIAGLFASAPASAGGGRCSGVRVTIQGDSGNNRIVGTPGDDVIDGKGGNDLIDAKGGDDIICGGNGNDAIKGGDGDDYVLGGGANDRINGGDGDDGLLGLLGDDLMVGGPGSDSIGYPFSPDPINASYATKTVSGEGRDRFGSVELIIGSTFDDVMVGNSERNGMYGDLGDDQLFGADGSDILYGDPGDDLIDGQGGTRDVLVYIFSKEPVTMDLAADTATSEGTDSIPNMEWVRGSPFDDTILGDDEVSFISGEAGDDTIDGRGGLDVAAYAFTSNAVSVNLAQGTATGDGTDSLTDLEAVYATPFDDVLVGNADDNVLFGDYGDDQISGGGGDDLIFPDKGNDTVDGGAGDNDEIEFRFALGPVTVDMGAGTATGDGNDSFTTVEVISGTQYDDTITGGPDDDKMMGEEGDDTLVGNGGNDAMDGGDGTDSVDGGPGSDICRNQETTVSCEGQGGPAEHRYREESRAAGNSQRRLAHRLAH